MSSFKTKITRELAAEYGRLAVQIIESGEYMTSSDRVVRIAEVVKRSVEGTGSYPPGQPFPGMYPLLSEQTIWGISGSGRPHD
jgi:hypothetical protein